MEFLGKFHPLIIHLPIGILIAAFGLELIFYKKDSDPLTKAIRFLLGFGALSAIFSSVLGYILAQQGGYENQLVSRHQWSAILFTVTVLLIFIFRNRLKNGKSIFASWTALILLITLTGHYGGSLTHGKNYLIDSAPEFIQKILNSKYSDNENKPLDSALVFDDVVMPLVEDKCLSCHNNEKKKGGLNLQSAVGWKKGGKNGQLFLAGNPRESLLLERIYLPLEAKKHMPPSGNAQLIASEIAQIEWWIGHGGNYDVKVKALETDERISKILEPFYESRLKDGLIEVPDLNEQTLINLQNKGIRILPVAQGSKLLEVNFTRDSLIPDQQLKALLKLKRNVIRMDFSYSGVKDEQLKVVNQFINLYYLSFAETGITSEGVLHLSNLDQLNYLNLHSTKISSDCMEQIRKMKTLQSLYVWNTNIDSSDIDRITKNRPDLNVYN